MSQSLLVTSDKTDLIEKGLQMLTGRRVLVGIPAGDTRKGDTPLTNAEIGYIHEFGSPVNNLPARPFLIPGVQKAKDKSAAFLADAAASALVGNKKEVADAFEKAGMIASSSVKAQFVDNDWQPLSKKTLTQKPIEGYKKNGKAIYGKSREEKGKTNPLLDSGQLRKSVTYIVEEK